MSASGQSPTNRSTSPMSGTTPEADARQTLRVLTLVSREAAFGRDRCAVHHARFVRGEEEGDVRDVLRLADSERVLSGYVVDAAEANLVAAGKATPDPFRQHDTGADGVDADTLGRVGAGQGPGERDQATLGHDVDMSDVVAAQGHHRREVDHAAIALLAHHRDHVPATPQRPLNPEVHGPVPP